MADRSELGKYPHLKEYFEHFERTGGVPEKREYLPFLVIWIRTIVEKHRIDPTAFFKMDAETADEFFSWGRNSRWANAFCSHVECNMEMVLEKCLELADTYGDIDVMEGEDY